MIATTITCHPNKKAGCPHRYTVSQVQGRMRFALDIIAMSGREAVEAFRNATEKKETLK